MARRHRFHSPTSTYHSMLRGNNGQDIFFSNADRVRFCLVLQQASERCDQRVEALCLMSNHIHLAVRTSDISIFKLMGLLMNYSRGWSLAPSKTRKEYSLRATIGVVGTFLCYFLVSLLPLPKSPFIIFCEFLFVSLWITTGSLLLCLKLLPSSKSPVEAK